jgi:hypothetical protein
MTRAKAPKRMKSRMSSMKSPLRRAALAALALAALAACAQGEKLPVATGPVFGLNPGYFQPTPAELRVPADVRP